MELENYLVPACSKPSSPVHPEAGLIVPAMNSLLAKPGQNSFWLLASKTQLQKARKRQKKGLLRKEDGPVPANFLILLTITPSTDQKDMVP